MKRGTLVPGILEWLNEPLFYQQVDRDLNVLPYYVVATGNFWHGEPMVRIKEFENRAIAGFDVSADEALIGFLAHCPKNSPNEPVNLASI